MKLTSGVWYMLAATALLALSSVAVKKLGKDFSPAVILVVRCGIGAALAAGQLRRAGAPVWGPAAERGNLLGRGGLGAISVVGGLLALQQLSIGGATTVTYLAPVVTAVAAIWLSQEPVRPVQWLFYAGSVAGVVIAKGTKGIFEAGTLIALGAAVASGVSSAFLRRIDRSTHPLTAVFYFNLVPLLVALAWLPFDDPQWPQPAEWGWLVASGLLAYAALWGITEAFSQQQAAFVASLDYLGLIYATALGALVFGDEVKWTVYPGIALVLLAVGANAWYSQKQEQEKARDEPRLRYRKEYAAR